MRDAMFAQGALQFVHADVFPGHVWFDGFSVVNQQTRFTLHDAPKSAIDAGESSDHVVQEQESRGRDYAANQRRVRPGHGILHGVRKQQQEREIEGRHLPDFALAAQPHPDEDDEVDDPRTQRNLQPHVSTRREKDSVQLAVTGTGALFGVLR